MGLGMIFSFVVVGIVCVVVVLCYFELVLMVLVFGLVYIYNYVVMGELIVWMVGWVLILEYVVVVFVVLVGWFGYFMGFLKSWIGFELLMLL